MCARVCEQLNCCGARGPQDYLYSAWFNHTRDFTGVFVPWTCCRLLAPATDGPPRVEDVNLCQVEAIVHRATRQPITQLHTQVRPLARLSAPTP